MCACLLVVAQYEHLTILPVAIVAVKSPQQELSSNFIFSVNCVHYIISWEASSPHIIYGFGYLAFSCRILKILEVERGFHAFVLYQVYIGGNPMYTRCTPVSCTGISVFVQVLDQAPIL